MKKKQRLAIDDALNSALKPPPARRPSENLNSLLSQYAPSLNPESIPPHSIPQRISPPENIPVAVTPPQNTPKREAAAKTTSPQDGATLVETSAERGYYPTFNDLDDRIIPGYKLDAFEQSVLRRLYRLSRGFKSQECEAGLGALSKACNISRSRVQKTINSLLDRGLIQALGHSQTGMKYRVLDQLPGIPQKGIPQYGIPQESRGIPQYGIPGIPYCGTIKHSSKHILNTHTTGGVGVCSKFSIEECRRYAEHLRSTGQGINNPGGYATTIHRTGEADELIERFLKPVPETAPLDVSGCPDCQGTGFYYPKGKTHGVVKCPHAALQS
jgi:hypothetical protein